MHDVEAASDGILALPYLGCEGSDLEVHTSDPGGCGPTTPMSLNRPRSVTLQVCNDKTVSASVSRRATQPGPLSAHWASNDPDHDQHPEQA